VALKVKVDGYWAVRKEAWQKHGCRKRPSRAGGKRWNREYDPTYDPTTYEPTTYDPKYEPTVEPTFSPTYEPTYEATYDPTYEPPRIIDDDADASGHYFCGSIRE